MSVSSGAPRPGDEYEKLVREQAERLKALRIELAQTQDALNAAIQAHAQAMAVIRLEQRSRVESREGAAAAAATELAGSAGSIWDGRRLALRPPPAAAMARLSRPACREWFARFEVPLWSSLRRRFFEDEWFSDDESDRPCRSSEPYKRLSRAARTIQVGLRPQIARKVRKARFVPAYMRLVHACQGKLTRHVLVHCATFLIGPIAPPYRDAHLHEWWS